MPHSSPSFLALDQLAARAGIAPERTMVRPWSHSDAPPSWAGANFCSSSMCFPSSLSESLQPCSLSSATPTHDTHTHPHQEDPSRAPRSPPTCVLYWCHTSPHVDQNYALEMARLASNFWRVPLVVLTTLDLAMFQRNSIRHVAFLLQGLGEWHTRLTGQGQAGQETIGALSYFRIETVEAQENANAGIQAVTNLIDALEKSTLMEQQKKEVQEQQQQQKQQQRHMSNHPQSQSQPQLQTQSSASSSFGPLIITDMPFPLSRPTQVFKNFDTFCGQRSLYYVTVDSSHVVPFTRLPQDELVRDFATYFQDHYVRLARQYYVNLVKKHSLETNWAQTGPWKARMDAIVGAVGPLWHVVEQQPHTHTKPHAQTHHHPTLLSEKGKKFQRMYNSHSQDLDHKITHLLTNVSIDDNLGSSNLKRVHDPSHTTSHAKTKPLPADPLSHLPRAAVSNVVSTALWHPTLYLQNIEFLKHLLRQNNIDTSVTIINSNGSLQFKPGETAAKKLLNVFCHRKIKGYHVNIECPANLLMAEYGSLLSPYLSFGFISPVLFAHNVMFNSKVASPDDKNSLLKHLAKRDLASNFCFLLQENNNKYQQAVPNWAKDFMSWLAQPVATPIDKPTMEGVGSNPVCTPTSTSKPKTFSEHDWEYSTSIDHFFNRLQKEARIRGRLMACNRRAWALKIIQFHENPEKAFNFVHYLNSKYMIDAYGTTNYSAVAEAFGHFQERKFVDKALKIYRSPQPEDINQAQPGTEQLKS